MPRKTMIEAIRDALDVAMGRDERVIVYGEDVGFFGGVFRATQGLQAKYGEHRIFDTGIREWTIVGQAIGMAMRGLRPIAEIQYLDYLIYALSPLSDDVATVRWRTHGQQAAPLIIRTRGHRLEGIWHSGSPMSVLLGSLRGMHICVPRNLTQAAGMYNTLLQSDDPGLVIEPLNGYRIKERLPDNLGSFTVPLGVPEVLSVTHPASLAPGATAVPVSVTVSVSPFELVTVTDTVSATPGSVSRSLSVTDRSRASPGIAPSATRRVSAARRRSVICCFMDEPVSDAAEPVTGRWA